MAKRTRSVRSDQQTFESGNKPGLEIQLAAGGRASARQNSSQSALGFVGGKGSESQQTSTSPAASDSAVLCNITDQVWMVHRTHGSFTVNACEPGADYALTAITGRQAFIDHGDGHRTEIPIPARKLAEDLAREINSDAGEGSYFGVFICEGSEPTDEELIEAHEKLENFYRSLVASADRTWERTHNVVLISDLERRAAKALKLEKEWCYEAQRRIDCPACGEKLKPGVAVCRTCGAVLDREKAAQFGLGAPSLEHAKAVANSGNESGANN
jgi:hypothetical protein